MPIIMNTGGLAESNAVSPQDTGWISFTTLTNFSTASGTTPHQNPTWGATSDGLYAGSVAFSTIFLQVLGCQGLIMPALPPSSIINGITIRYSPVAFIGNAVETYARLIVGGVLSGDQKNASQFYPVFASGFTHVRGGVADTWGLSLTAADINAADFGVGVSHAQGSGLTAAGIDHVQMRVSYTA